MKWSWFGLVLAIVAVFLGGCPTGTPPASLSISPLSLQLNIGQTATFSVTSPDTSDFFTWGTNNPSVVTVDSRGRVTAVSAGTARITATSGRNSASVSATVTVAGSITPSGDVSVSPSAATIVVGDTVLLTATSLEPFGDFLWFSEDETIATVDANGLVTGVGVGTVAVNVRGATPEERATATITVLAPTVHTTTVSPLGASILVGATIALTATSTDETDEFIWTTDAASTATVDASGVVTGVGPGGVIISARGTNSGTTGSAVITVSRAALHRVTVSPSTLTIAVGDRIGLEVSTTRVGDQFTWSSGDDTIATVDQLGFITGQGAGLVSITAQGMDPAESGTAVVRVVEAVTRVAIVRPSSASIPAGDSIALTATSGDASEGFVWASEDPSVATVSSLGVVTGVVAGTAGITAVGATTGATGRSSITVTAPVVHRVTTAPAGANIAVGDILALTAASTKPGDRIAWSSDSEGVATVDGNGLVTGIGAGMASVTANGLDSGESGASLVTVVESPGEEAEVRVGPSSATIVQGETVALSATSTDPLDDFVWSSSNTAAATVNTSGMVAGVTPGTATITALGQNSGESGSALITVEEPPVVVAVVRVSPRSANMAEGESITLGAVSTDPLDSFVWSSSNTAAVTVNASGVATGVAAGTATITAQGENSGESGTAMLTVEGPPAAVSVSPLSASITEGETIVLSGTSTDPQDAFLWSSSDSAIATVTTAGTVAGVAPGTVQITGTGTNSGATGTSEITVGGAPVHEVLVLPVAASIEAGGVFLLSATSTRPGDTIVWFSADEMVATVDAAGLVTGVTAGTVAITASGTLSGASGTATITVTEPVADQAIVRPLEASILVGGSVALTAESTDAGDSFNWSSEDGTVAMVNSSGLVTGTGPGISLVTAAGTNSGATGSSTITVAEQIVHIVTVSPSSALMLTGGTLQLAATTTRAGDTFTWSTNNSAVATVNTSGLVSGVSAGAAMIFAQGSTPNERGVAMVTVVDPVVHTVSVRPLGASIAAGESIALTATSTDPSDTFTWSSLNGSVASVDSAGLVTGTATGTAAITALGSRSGAAGTATIVVTEPAVHSVTVLPPSATIEIAANVALSATSTDSADTFTWTSADVAIATVSASGVVTGVGAGEVAVTASGTSSGKTASVVVTVVEATVHQVTLDPVSAIVFVGSTVALSASSTDTEDSLTWTTANSAVATVNASGVVTGTGAGMVEIIATGTNSGAHASAVITVNAHTVTVSPPSVALLAGTSTLLSATSTNPGDSFTWTSSDTSIAIVNPAGMVTGVVGGVVQITASGTLSGQTASATVTVRDGVAVNPPSGRIGIGFSLQLSAISTDPGDAFTWTVSNPAIAVVDGNGLVSGVSTGNVSVTATGTSSGVSASASIGVVPVLSVNPTEAEVAVGRVLPIIVQSLDIEDDLAWVSSDPAVATVNALGYVTGVSVGTTRISVTADHSGGIGFADVRVLPEFPNAVLFDAEDAFTTSSRIIRNTAEAFRGLACVEGIPDQFAGFTLRLRQEFFGADLRKYDEIWMMIKSQGTGAHASFNFRGSPETGSLIELTDYATDGVIGSTYELIRIPIQDLTSATFDFSGVETMTFGKREVGENYRLFVDEIRAVNLESVDANGGPIVGALPLVNLGGVSVMTGATETVTVRNIGGSTLIVRDLAIEGPGATAFAAEPSAFELAPGAAQGLDITFMPEMAGEYEATLVLSHNGTAFGDESRMELRANGLAARLQLSREAVDFGQIPLPGSVVQELTFTNTGNEPLTVTGLAASNPIFTLSGTGFTVNAGQTHTLTITSLPAVLGTSNATLSCTTNDPNRTAVSIPLQVVSLAVGSLGRLPLSVLGSTSSSLSIDWGRWPLADAVRIVIGPEPPAQSDAALPLEFEVASLSGNASTFRIDGLASDVDVFVRVEVSVLGVPIAVRNIAAHTPGGQAAELDSPLREAHICAPNILQLIMTDYAVHSFRDDGDNDDYGINEIVGFTGPAWQAGPWTILRADGTEIAVNNVYRHSVPIGNPYYELGWAGAARPDLIDVDHSLYLELAENIGSPEVLRITGPSFNYDVLTMDLERESRSASLDVLLPFSDRYLVSTAIQVNQVGYSPAATRRYAYVSGWMGDGGPLPLNGFPPTAQVITESANPVVPRSAVLSNLPIALRSAFDSDAGAEVRDIDIVALPASDSAIYRVRIPGVGVSWPTKVSELEVFRSFYTLARGLFQNRWAGDLRPEFTDWSRPQDHGTVFTSEGLDPFAQFPVDTPLVGERPLIGGHHDAADFDIRIFHSIVAQTLMRAYEINQDAHTDGQLIIPESGNGVPDLLDEALWSIAGWEYLQEDDGGVRIGAESYRHPFGTFLAHEDPLPYFTYSRDPSFSARCAGLFAQASRLVAPFDAVRAHTLMERAIRAYEYAVANGVTGSAGGTIMYATSELYRLTGEEEYRDALVETWNANLVFDRLAIFDRSLPNIPSFIDPDQPIQWDHISGYLGSGTALQSHMDYAVDLLRTRPASIMVLHDTAHAHRHGRRDMSAVSFGKATAVGQYLFGTYAAMQYGDLDEESFQTAFDTMSLSADYTLGCNPNGWVWFTGLGSRRPRDSDYRDGLAFTKLGLGPVPGIPVYGPRDSIQTNIYYQWGSRLASPPFADAPTARRYADLHTFVQTSEFTVAECQAPMVQLFASMIAPGMMPPESWLPAARRAAGKEGAPK